MYVNAELLDRDTERTLAYRARAGDTDARNRVVMGLYRLVYQQAVKLATKYRCEADELAQDAVAKILRSFGTYNPEFGWRACTYFLTAARREMELVLSTRGLITTPSTERHRMRREHAMAVRRARRVARLGHRLPGGDRLGDLIPDRRADCPVRLACHAEELDRLRAEMEKLPKRWRAVMHRRLAGETMESIAGRLRVSKERVRQIELQSRAALRRALKESA